MCGISGYTGFLISDENSTIHQLSASMRHRGPDYSSHFKDGQTVLVHNRLSIIDLNERSNQPMISHGQQYVICYNGEIYNFNELARQLGLTLRTSSDTEVLLEGFVREKFNLFDKLNGMFAFAIYDKSSGNIVLARDRAGIKPLFYYHDGMKFAFASEMKSLLCIPEIRQKLTLNTEAIYHFLHLGFIPEPDTIYRQISKFPAGNHAVFSKGHLSFERYWSLQEVLERPRLLDEKSAAAELENLLEDAVAKRLISDVPFGTFLSGGIDSSIITAMAARVSPHRIKTFTIGFSDNDFDESVHARKVASHLKTEHQEYFVNEQDALDRVDEAIMMYDEPFADSSAIPTMVLSKLAANDVTMVLSGDGGDELFMGYGTQNWAKRLNNPLLSTFHHPIASILNQLGNRERRAANLFRYKDFNHIQRHILSQEQYFFRWDEIPGLLGPGFHHSDIHLPPMIFPSSGIKPSEKQAAFDFQHYLRDDLLVKVDRATMIHSLECRLPLLDYRLVEFAFQLSPELRKKGNISKYILRNILYKMVPQELVDRPKRGFSVPMDRWLRSNLRWMVEEFLSEKRIKNAGIFNPMQIENIRNDYYKKGRKYLFNRIWALVVLMYWFEKNPINS